MHFVATQSMRFMGCVAEGATNGSVRAGRIAALSSPGAGNPFARARHSGGIETFTLRRERKS